MNRNLNIDLIKAVACFSVIGIHSFAIMPGTYSILLYYAFSVGVPLFFMVSGFFLTAKDPLTLRYIGKKCLSYLRVIALWGIILIPFVLIVYRDRRITIKSYVIDYLRSFVQRSMSWQVWYLWAAVLTFLAVFIILSVCRKAGIRHICLLCWLVFAAVCEAIQIASYVRGYHVSGGIAQTFRLWIYLSYIFLGGMMNDVCAFLKQRISTLLHLLILAAYTAAVTLFMYFAGQRILGSTLSEYFYGELLCQIWMALIFSFILRLDLGKSARKAVAFVSPLTLAIYLIHPFVVQFFREYESFNMPRQSVLLFFIASAVSLIISWLLNLIPGHKYYMSI